MAVFNHYSNLVLVGLKHSGKSLISRLVAEQLSVPCVDTDNEIRKLFLDRTGKNRSVREIFRADDGKTFRDLETTVCRQLGTGVIVATGGGLCDNGAACDALAEGFIAFLHASEKTLFERISRRGMPAFLKEQEPREARKEFAALYSRRFALYREMADAIIETDGKTPEQVARAVVDIAEEVDHGRK